MFFGMSSLNTIDPTVTSTSASTIEMPRPKIGSNSDGDGRLGDEAQQQ